MMIFTLNSNKKALNNRKIKHQIRILSKLDIRIFKVLQIQLAKSTK